MADGLVPKRMVSAGGRTGCTGLQVAQTTHGARRDAIPSTNYCVSILSCRLLLQYLLSEARTQSQTNCFRLPTTALVRVYSCMELCRERPFINFFSFRVPKKYIMREVFKFPVVFYHLKISSSVIEKKLLACLRHMSCSFATFNSRPKLHDLVLNQTSWYSSKVLY